MSEGRYKGPANVAQGPSSLSNVSWPVFPIRANRVFVGIPYKHLGYSPLYTRNDAVHIPFPMCDVRCAVGFVLRWQALRACDPTTMEQRGPKILGHIPLSALLEPSIRSGTA